jgi:hypothetical protein
MKLPREYEIDYVYLVSVQATQSTNQTQMTR